MPPIAGAEPVRQMASEGDSDTARNALLRHSVRHVAMMVGCSMAGSRPSAIPLGGSRTVSRTTTAATMRGIPTTKNATRQPKNSFIQPPARKPERMPKGMPSGQLGCRERSDVSLH
jgi:hypothetical protein